MYPRKVPKVSDARKLSCNLPKSQTKKLNLWIFHQKDANGIANTEDPDQTAPLGAVWSGSAVCPDISVRKLMIITVKPVSLNFAVNLYDVSHLCLR